MLFFSANITKSTHKDRFVAYKMETENNNNLVYEAVKAAKREVTAELQRHSDQGIQYTSEGYFKLTSSYVNINPGKPSWPRLRWKFFSTLKSEWFNRYMPSTKEEARLLLDEYIHFYNHERIQLKLNRYVKTCVLHTCLVFQSAIVFAMSSADMR